MKNSTFSAQVATNLLNVLQGYSKTIRLLLVMFVALSVSAEVWGADVTINVASETWTNAGTSSTGDTTMVSKSGVTVSSNKGYKDGTTAIREYFGSNITVSSNDNITKIVFTSTANMGSKYGPNCIALKSGSAGTYTTSSNSNLGTWTGTAKSITFSCSAQFRWTKIVVTIADAHTVTWTINPASGGTLSASSGNTTTVTPNVAYTYDSPAYTVTPAGNANVSQDGDNFTATPSANCTIQINMVEKPKYTVTWNVNGEVYETTQVIEGSKPTFPATPSSCDATSNTFYGWATATWDGKIDNIIGKTIYTSANDMPAVNGAVTYYAVFATKGDSGGTAFDGTSGGDFKIYALVEGKKKYLQGTGSKISPVDEAQATEYTFTKISDGVFSIKTGTTYLTYASSSDLGTSNSAYSWTISTGTKGSWRIASKNTTTRGIVYRAGTTNQFGGYALSNITANGTEYYDVEIGGGASVSYSGYITTCAAGDPCASLQAPNVTATATANSITLSWDAVDGAISYNVYNYTTHAAEVVNVLTYTFNGLAPETEYSWEVEAVSATCNGKGTQGTTTTLAEAPTSYTITFETNGGTNIDKITNATALPNPLPEPTREHYTFAGWFTDEDCTQAAKAGATIDADITLYAKWTELPTYTVSFSTGTGNPTQVAIQETIGGAGITLPAGPTPACSTAGWEFAGWWTEAVTETTTSPGALLNAGSNYKPASDCTLHAVYSYTEAGGGDSNVTFNFSDIATANSWTNGTAYTTVTISPITINAKGGGNNGKYYSSNTSWRMYNGGSLQISSNTGKITSVSSNPSKTFTINDEGTATLSFSATTEFTSITVSYSSTTTTYNSNPSCEVCENILTISKGAETNGTFTLSQSGNVETCDGDVEVVVTPTPVEHYSVSEVTATTPTTGGAPNVNDNGNGTWTVTYAQNSTGTSTINVTFVEDAKASITLSELGVEKTDNTTYYVGAQYTLPTTSLQSCAGKQLVGWSTVEVDETDTKPTDNYYELGAKVTLKATQTFYAVFAAGSGDGGKGWTAVTSTSDLEAGATYAISSAATEGTYLSTWAEGNNFPGSASIICPLILGGSAGAWTFQIADGGTYNDQFLTATKTTSSNYLKAVTTADDYSVFTISFGETNKNAVITCTEKTSRNILRFNSQSTLFACYSSGQSDVYLQKLTYTAYSTSCNTHTVTFYGFNSGGYTTTCNDNPAEIAVAQGATYVIPNCSPESDPAKLGRTFAGTWNTQADGQGTTYKPGDEIVNVSNDITLYAQWALNTSENTTLPTNIDDLATTDIVVNSGTTLTLKTGTTTINSLTLKGGLLGKDSKSGYDMPSVVIPEGATLVRNNTTINLDLVINSDSWYPFAVPFAVANTSNIDYLDPVLQTASIYGTHFAIKTYDGENRAKVGTDQANNWDIVPESAGLQPGKGYIISALTYPDKDTATIRIPMTVPNEWLANGEQTTVNEVTRNQVAVTAYTGNASDHNKGGHQRHAGWNFVANPYLSNFAGTNASGSFINGKIIINQGDYSYGGEDVPYVTIPTYNFASYSQRKLSEAELSPAYSFFVQVGESGTMTFDVAGRQAAPASIAARNAEERPVKMDVDLILSDNHSSDQTGIIICDRYSDAYEIGRDLEKLFGSAYNLSVYTLMADNTPLAFQALAIRSSMQVIPVGYHAPEQGEYTFRLNEATSSIDLLNEQYEQLVLVDYQTGELTNLLIADYTFYSERTQADNRFAIYAVPRQNAPTDLPNAIGQDKQAQKILHNGHLYILRDGNVYNGNGQIVK